MLLKACETEDYRITLNETTYDITNPTGIEILSSSEGCDSILVIDLDFSQTQCAVYFPNVINPLSRNSDFYPVFKSTCGITIDKLQIYDR